MGEYRMLRGDEVLQVGDEFAYARQAAREWSPVHQGEVGKSVADCQRMSPGFWEYRRPLAAKEVRPPSSRPVPCCACGHDVITNGGWGRGGGGHFDKKGMCNYAPPAAVPNERVTQAPRDGFDHTPKPAPLTEERIAALTYEADVAQYVGGKFPIYPGVTRPGPGLIHENIRRVCPTCEVDVPGYLARCKCGALDRPVYRLTDPRGAK